MIKIPQDIKELYEADGYPKNVRIHFPNKESPDITSENIEKGSVRFTESLCSRDTLKLGLTEISSFECTVVGAPNVIGAKIEVTIEIVVKGKTLADYDEADKKYLKMNTDGDLVCAIPYGTFEIEESVRMAGVINKREIRAYTYGLGAFANVEIKKKLMLTKEKVAYKYDIVKSALACTNFKMIGNTTYTEIPLAELYVDPDPSIISLISEEVPEIPTTRAGMNSYSVSSYDIFDSDDYLNPGDISISSIRYTLTIKSIPIVLASEDQLYRYTCDWLHDCEDGISPYDRLLNELIDQINTTNYGDLPTVINSLKSNLPLAVCPNAEFESCESDGTAITKYFESIPLAHTSGNIYPYLSCGDYSKSGCSIGVHIPYALSLRYVKITDRINVTIIDKPDIQFKHNIHAYKFDSDLFGKHYYTVNRIASPSNSKLFMLNAEKDIFGYEFISAFTDKIESLGKTVRISREDALEITDYLGGERLYPDNNLYPNDTVFPVGSVSDTLTMDRILKDSCIFDESKVLPYRYVTLTYEKVIDGTTSKGEVTITYDIMLDKFSHSYSYSVPDKKVLIDDETLLIKQPISVKRRRAVDAIPGLTYDLSENTIIKSFGENETEMKKVMRAVAKSLTKIDYTPAEFTTVGTPFYEAGDTIQVKTQYGVFTTVILTHTLSGENFITDNIRSR